LIGLAAEKRTAGGSTDLIALLEALRRKFSFRDHPDYRPDWEILDRQSHEAIEDVRTEIQGLPPCQGKPSECASNSAFKVVARASSWANRAAASQRWQSKLHKDTISE
jgi:hypothetical protein